MAKVRNLSDIQQEIAFTEFDFYQRYEESFKTSELGRIKSLLPFRERAYKIMCGISSQLGEHRLRTKYNDIEKANLAYRKQRKHTHKQTRKMIMRLKWRNQNLM